MLAVFSRMLFSVHHNYYVNGVLCVKNCCLMRCQLENGCFDIVLAYYLFSTWETCAEHDMCLLLESSFVLVLENILRYLFMQVSLWR